MIFPQVFALIAAAILGHAISYAVGKSWGVAGMLFFILQVAFLPAGVISFWAFVPVYLALAGAFALAWHQPEETDHKKLGGHLAGATGLAVAAWWLGTYFPAIDVLGRPSSYWTLFLIVPGCMVPFLRLRLARTSRRSDRFYYYLCYLATGLMLLSWMHTSIASSAADAVLLACGGFYLLHTLRKQWAALAANQSATVALSWLPAVLLMASLAMQILRG